MSEYKDPPEIEEMLKRLRARPDETPQAHRERQIACLYRTIGALTHYLRTGTAGEKRLVRSIVDPMGRY